MKNQPYTTPRAPSRVFHIQMECPRCGSTLVIKENKKTSENFIACSSYHNKGCRHSEKLSAALQALAAENYDLWSALEKLQQRVQDADEGYRESTLKDIQALYNAYSNLQKN